MSFPATIEDSTSAGGRQARGSCQRLWSSVSRPSSSSSSSSTNTAKTPAATYPPISSIPPISAERLARASPDAPPSRSADTYLYLAYGSNLSAETFLGTRGIRPLSKLNVSAPALDLTFDLPGIPYFEPCFANVALRKKMPDVPVPPGKPPLPHLPPASLFPSLPPRGPTWNQGLVGVVYEVTAADYAEIIRTEGGGSGYQDVLTPCVALPAPIRVPEKPPIPELPRPFLAHTLFLPRRPDDAPAPPGGAWWRQLLLPVRRPEADYAQPSARYLKLIRDGAAEHGLPADYQAYLAKLQPYTITQWRQKIGRWLLALLWLPLLLTLLGLSKLTANKNGRIPKWMGAAMNILFNMVWASYDAIFMRWLGDGERTMEDEDEATPAHSWWRLPSDELRETQGLLKDW